MSTASLDKLTSLWPTPSRAMMRRFAWKEYRMLRGLWLAVAVMAMLVMWAIGVMTPPQYDFAMLYFSTALGAAVIYAVGAAATMFSVEHEEETFAFLNGLPTEWWPVYAGKLVVAAVSAVALAVVLAVVGWIACGFDTPGGHDTPAALGLFGVMIVEFLAWGTLFSLLIKRPLVAAIVTLIVGGLTLHVVVIATSASTVAGLEPEAYLEAIPVRLAIVVVVFACSVLAARNWLVVGACDERGKRFKLSDMFIAPRAAWRAVAGRVGRVAVNGARRKMLARLLWQTWRESWKFLLLPWGVAAALFLGIGAFMGLVGANDVVTTIIVVAMPLFVPALYGAMAFHADQRRGSYRFLAEHAARPRYVWLARHVVWLGALACVFALVTYVAGGVIAAGVRYAARQALDHYLDWGWGGSGLTGPEMARDFEEGTRYAIMIALLGLFGALAVYGVGQLCSMIMRSEILAAFIAIVFTVAVSTWICVLFLWQLPGWLFLFPLAAGCMFATWLRAPDWLAGRNTWQAWLRPGLAVAAPILLVGLLLPVVRLAQITTKYDPRLPPPGPDVESWQQRDTPEARGTAAMFAQAAEQASTWPEEDFLQPWRKPEFTFDPSLEGLAPGSLGEIDEVKIPKDQLDAYIAAKKRQHELMRKWQDDAVNLAIEAGKQPTCWFSFNVDAAALAPAQYTNRFFSLETDQLYISLRRLTESLIEIAPDTAASRAIERFIAAIHLGVHMRSGQPSVIYLDQARIENDLMMRVGKWAEEKGRTKDELRELLSQLEGEFQTSPPLDHTLLADHVLVRKAIEGQITPLVLAQQPLPQPVFLAYLANQLPWERERAIQVLYRITWYNLHDVTNLMNFVGADSPSDFGLQQLRRWLRPTYDNGIPPAWEVKQPELMTSYLAVMEYRARVPLGELNRAFCDNEVYRRATLLRIALAMYRLDHNSYPSLLAGLVPDYITQLPLDPYSRQEFQYEPVGINLPLHIRNDQNRIASVESIPADTPLLWSVGSGDARIRRRENTDYEPGSEDNPEGEAMQVSKPVAMLMSDEAPWWNDPVLVFPLPK